MIKVRIKRNISEDMLQEAMRLEDMGLPTMLVTLIKNDVKKREAQVRLGSLLKEKELPLRVLRSVNNLAGKSFQWRDLIDTGGDSEKVSKIEKIFGFSDTDTMAGLEWIRASRRFGIEGIPQDQRNDRYTLKNLKGLRKSINKMLRKLDLSEKAINQRLDEIIIQYYQYHIQDSDEGNKIVAFLNEHPDNHKDIADMNLNEAEDYVSSYFEQKEDENRIVKKYEKENLFWYHLGEGSCDLEAQRMGHCGADDRGVLFSLRSKGPKQKVSDSHVTISYNEFEDTVYQIKGKQNCTPDEKYGPYIVDFLEMYDVKRIEESGEHSSCDFSEFIQYLSERYEAEYSGNNLQQLEELDSEISNGDYDTEYINFSSEVDEYSYGDRPVIVINASVGFDTELDLLNDISDEQWEKIEEFFEDEYEDITESVIDACGFDHYDSYSSEIDLTINRVINGSVDITTGFDLSGDNNYHRDREEAESYIRELKYSYEDSDIDNFRNDIDEVMMKYFKKFLSSESIDEFNKIKDRISEIEDGFNYFTAWLNEEEDEIVFHTVEVELPIRIPILPRPNKFPTSQNVPYTRELRTYNRMIASNIEDMRISLINSVQDHSKKAIAAAKRQVRLPLDIPKGKEPKVIIRPQLVNFIVTGPSDNVLSGGLKHKNQETIVPRIRMKIEMTLTWTDDLEDILGGMEYISYMDKNMSSIIRNTQKNMDKFEGQVKYSHGLALKSILKMMNENKRRSKIKVRLK